LQHENLVSFGLVTPELTRRECSSKWRIVNAGSTSCYFNCPPESHVWTQDSLVQSCVRVD